MTAKLARLAVLWFVVWCSAETSIADSSEASWPGCYRLSYGAWTPSAEQATLAQYLPPNEIELVSSSKRQARLSPKIPRRREAPEVLQWSSCYPESPDTVMIG
jgi:hypothetical protein